VKTGRVDDSSIITDPFERGRLNKLDAGSKAFDEAELAQ
jgi:hypothetical protein